MYLIFVYGSLLTGLGNHRHLDHDGARFEGAGHIEGLDLFDVGPFPYIAAGDGVVKGEFYMVDGRTRHNLDRLEGFNPYDPNNINLYDRIVLDSGAAVWSNGDAVDAQVYTYVAGRVASPRAPRVDSGDWRAHYNQKHGKAA
jgi:gamma-glutamylcyclotransferase (GGCT)/AIG2-like uncharacterized protein YtfP